MGSDPSLNPDGTPTESAQAASFDDVVALCIEALEDKGADGLEAILERHPEDADRLRRRLAMLSKHGLLSIPDPNGLDQVGPYRIVRPLGAGGMGEVHLAEHHSSGQRVALKLGPRPALDLTAEHKAQTARAGERFERETQAVAAMDHPSIVPVVDRGVHEGRPWFAMEYVEGVGLDQLLEAVRTRGQATDALTGADFASILQVDGSGLEGRTWLEAVGGVVLQVAEALAQAHGEGVVHRDVKPSNILVCADGSARLVDFGLAHLSELPTLTLPGEFAGTPYYVAPEQIANVRDGIDGRADVFALGVTLYECVSLTKPFLGNTPTEVLAAISGREPTPLRKVAAHLPADLELVCRRALEKDRGQRYQSMSAFADDLRRLLTFRPLLTKPPSPIQVTRTWARRRPWRAASACLAGVLLVGAPIGLLAANAKIRSERDLVVAESTRKDAVVEHLVGHFDRSGSTSATNEAARELLTRGVERIDGDFADQPQVRAALLHASGRAFLNLGLAGEARPLLDRSFALWQREGESGGDERARVLADIGRVHLLEGRPSVARDIAQRVLNEAPDDVLANADGARATIAAAHAALGDVDLARAELQRIRSVPEGSRDEVARVWEAIGRQANRANAGDRATLEIAREALERALELRRNSWAPDPIALADVHDGLADVARALDGDGSAAAVQHAARAARLRAANEPAEASSVTFPFRTEPPWERAYTESFDRAVAALQSEQLEEACEHFTAALEHRPIPAVAAYNLACVEAQRGDVPSAVRWLERAHREGFACAEGRAHAVRHDTDLDAVRRDPAGRDGLRALELQWKEAQGFSERTVLRVPPLDRSEASPLLVVLHPDGAVASSEAEAGWSDLAERLGAILLVPSAPYLSAAHSGQGTQWSPDPRELFDQPGPLLRPVLDQVRAVLSRERVDRDRVWIAGRGVGALLALELLTDRPGLFRGGLLVDPILHERSGGGSGALPAALGTRLAVVISSAKSDVYRLEEETGPHVARLTEWLADDARWVDSVRVERAPLWNQAAPSLMDWIRGE